MQRNFYTGLQRGKELKGKVGQMERTSLMGKTVSGEHYRASKHEAFGASLAYGETRPFMLRSILKTESSLFAENRQEAPIKSVPARYRLKQ